MTTAPLLAPTERLAWLRLARSDNVGPVTFHQLVARFGTATAALEALPEIVRRGGRAKPLAIASISEAEREMEAIERLGGRLIARGLPAGAGSNRRCAATADRARPPGARRPAGYPP